MESNIFDNEDGEDLFQDKEECQDLFPTFNPPTHKKDTKNECQEESKEEQD